MSANHNPNPWRVVKRANQLGIRSLSVTNDKTAHGVWEPARTGKLVPISPEMVAVANRFAASADMLEALRTFPGFTDDATVGDAWIEKMRAAIAKATGAA